LVEHLAFNQ